MWGYPLVANVLDYNIIVSNCKLKSRTYIHLRTITLGGCPRGVMVKAMFVPQSRYYVHFRANTLGKGMNPLILPPAIGK